MEMERVLPKLGETQYRRSTSHCELPDLWRFISSPFSISVVVNVIVKITTDQTFQVLLESGRSTDMDG
jgi:hypothetical protein